MRNREAGMNPAKGLPHLHKVARRTQALPQRPSCRRIRSYIDKMGRSLVIVESPAKAKTINKYLGRDYTVKASIGHVMDLPKKTIGIRLPDEPKKKKKGKGKKGKAAAEKPQKPITLDDPKIFEPTLQIISGKGKVINDLRKSANTADAIYLAGDPDREGEAISAHLAMVLSKPTKYEEAEPSGPNAKFGKNGNNGKANEEAEDPKSKSG